MERLVQVADEVDEEEEGFGADRCFGPLVLQDRLARRDLGTT
jgi:hypothetical protein